MKTLQEEIKFLTKKYRIHPQRESGQNFMIDETVLDSMIEVADLKKTDNVLEIGAGFGPLTKRIAEKVNKVWAVELEKRFIPPLKKLEKSYPSLEVVHQDIIKVDVGKLLDNKKYKIVANVPYNITSLIFRKFLEKEHKPSSMSLLIQKEVAERIVATPGDLSLLAISVQFYGTPSIVKEVSKESFWPEPKVDSAIIHIKNIKAKKELIEENSVNNYDFTEKQFFQVVKAGFSAKRKQIHNNLANSLHADTNTIKDALVESGIIPTNRPQDITIDDWKKLVFTLKKEEII